MAGEDKITVKLKHPVNHGEEKLTEIDVRRIKGKDLRGIPDIKSMDGQLKIIERVTEQPTSVVNQLDLEDIEAIGEALGNFGTDSR